MNIRVKITRAGQPHYGDVVTLDIEDYLIGVVSSEMSDAWPLEALKAQAVAARTFALRNILARKSAYDVDDTTAYQAYKARKPGQCPRVEQAVRETAGVVLLWDGKPASTNYAASNGGRMISAKERWGSTGYPYLISKDDPWDKASGYKKNGHGVGMSQRGAQWAANHGVGAGDILDFYYPGTTAAADYGSSVVAPTPKPAYDPKEMPVLSKEKGSTGEYVKLAQELLGAKGYTMPKSILPSGEYNGKFWVEMDNWVRKFQRDHGLDDDGKIGPLTWAEMLS